MILHQINNNTTDVGMFSFLVTTYVHSMGIIILPTISLYIAPHGSYRHCKIFSLEFLYMRNESTLHVRR